MVIFSYFFYIKFSRDFLNLIRKNTKLTLLVLKKILLFIFYICVFIIKLNLIYAYLRLNLFFNKTKPDNLFFKAFYFIFLLNRIFKHFILL